MTKQIIFSGKASWITGDFQLRELTSGGTIQNCDLHIKMSQCFVVSMKGRMKQQKLCDQIINDG